MGLARFFGNQGYVCENCGHAMALYSPHCPVCLNKSLNRVQNQKAPGGSRPVEEAETSTERKKSPVFMVVFATILVVLVAAYTMMGHKNTDSSRSDDRSADMTNHAETISTPRVSRVQTVKRPKHVDVRPSSAHTSAAAASAPAKRVVPMKLWQVSGDSDSGQ